MAYKISTTKRFEIRKKIINPTLHMLASVYNVNLFSFSVDAVTSLFGPLRSEGTIREIVFEPCHNISRTNGVNTRHKLIVLVWSGKFSGFLTN